MRKFLLAVVAAMMPTVASAGDFSVSTGSSLSSGRYGGTDATRIASTSLGIRSGVGAWQINATVPYLNVDTATRFAMPNGVVVESDVVSGRGRSRQSGYGDMQLRIDRPIASVTNFPVDARITVNFKLPTGAKRFSNGKVDSGLGMEFSRAVGPVTPYVSAGYRIYGDRPGLRLANGWSTSAGAIYTRGPLTFIASYERSHSPYAGPAPRELFGVASYTVAPGWNWSMYGSKGLSAGSANLMVGTALTRSIF